MEHRIEHKKHTRHLFSTKSRSPRRFEANYSFQSHRLIGFNFKAANSQSSPAKLMYFLRHQARMTELYRNTGQRAYRQRLKRNISILLAILSGALFIVGLTLFHFQA